MRAIRAVYNLTIARNFTKESNQPFKKYKVSKLKRKGHKGAFSGSDLSKIATLDYPKHPHLIYTRVYFMKLLIQLYSLFNHKLCEEKEHRKTSQNLYTGISH